MIEISGKTYDFLIRTAGKLIDALKKPETASLILRLVAAAGIYSVDPATAQQVIAVYLVVMAALDKWWDSTHPQAVAPK